jgi:hypothetical protein
MNIRFRRTAVLILPAVLAGLALFSPGGVRSDSSGCSRREGMLAVRGGCVSSSPDSVCYHCEYARSGGGYSICGENVSGDVSLCIDYDDIPF